MTEDWRKEHHAQQDLTTQSECDLPHSKLPDIPDSWRWQSTTRIFEFVTSGSRGWAKYYSDSGAVFLRIGNLDHDTIDLDLREVQHVTPPQSAEGRRTRVREGDILISITADVGMIALVQSEVGEAYINQHVSLARPNDTINRRFLAYYLTSRHGQDQFKDLQRGATKVGLGLDDIRSVWVATPSASEQDEIVHRIESALKLADGVEERYRKAKASVDKLTQSILAKAFRGKLVPQDPNDLPAPRLGKWFVYALECDDGSIYVGQAQDVQERWKAHAAGRGAEWTRRHPPVKLVHWEEFDSLEAAVKREKELKTGFGRKWLKREIAARRTRQAGESAEILLERIRAKRTPTCPRRFAQRCRRAGSHPSASGTTFGEGSRNF